MILKLFALKSMLQFEKFSIGTLNRCAFVNRKVCVECVEPIIGYPRFSRKNWIMDGFGFDFRIRCKALSIFCFVVASLTLKSFSVVVFQPFN